MIYSSKFSQLKFLLILTLFNVYLNAAEDNRDIKHLDTNRAVELKESNTVRRENPFLSNTGLSTDLHRIIEDYIFDKKDLLNLVEKGNFTKFQEVYPFLLKVLSQSEMDKIKNLNNDKYLMKIVAKPNINRADFRAPTLITLFMPLVISLEAGYQVFFSGRPYCFNNEPPCYELKSSDLNYPVIALQTLGLIYCFDNRNIMQRSMNFISNVIINGCNYFKQNEIKTLLDKTLSNR